MPSFVLSIQLSIGYTLLLLSAISCSLKDIHGGLLGVQHIILEWHKRHHILHSQLLYGTFLYTWCALGTFTTSTNNHNQRTPKQDSIKVKRMSVSSRFPSLTRTPRWLTLAPPVPLNNPKHGLRGSWSTAESFLDVLMHTFVFSAVYNYSSWWMHTVDNMLAHFTPHAASFLN